MFLDDLKTVYVQNKDQNSVYVRNLLKERILYYVLHFISQSKWAGSLIFKGGTCLRIFFDLPRLSEDLDFDLEDINSFEIEEFITRIKDYFLTDLKYPNLETKLAGNKRTLYLKFPILDKLGMSVNLAESNIIFVRIDVASVEGAKYSTEISQKSTSNFSLLIKRYSLPDLMAGKIAAILTREKMEGKIKVERTKGRDYYDLIWYLEKNIQPNWVHLLEITGLTKIDVLQKLNTKINSVDLSMIQDDLSSFIADQSFVKAFCTKIKDIYKAKMLK